MRVLVACECSGVVRDAYLAQGHDAWSCDLQPAVSNPRRHIQGDALEVAYRTRKAWDLLIAHPPCTYLTLSSSWALMDPPYHQQVKPGTLTGAARRKAQQDAAMFFMALYNAPVKRVAIENPPGAMATLFRKPDQIIQPYDFGDDASKRTGLHLRGLPTLRPTQRIAGRLAVVDGRTYERWANQTDSGQNNEPEMLGR